MNSLFRKFKNISNLTFNLSNEFEILKRFGSTVTIVEVGPRDGLQNEKVFVPLELKVELINRLSDIGLKRIESGSFVNPKLIPQFIDSAQVFAKIKRKPKVSYSALVPNVKGVKAAIEAKVGEIAIFAAASEVFSHKNINCSIEESFVRFKDVIKLAKENNMTIRGYLSCVVACPYSGKTEPKLVANLAKKMIDIGCFEVSLGDTIGVGTPDNIADMLGACFELCEARQLAIHCHDTNGMAVANVTRALEMGISVVDSSIAGLGGCPFAGPGATGNVSTEKIAALLHGRGLLCPDIDRAKIDQVATWIKGVIAKEAKTAKPKLPVSA